MSAPADYKWWCSECKGLVDTPNEHSKAQPSHHIFRVNGRPVYRSDPVPGHYYECANSAIGYIFGPLSREEREED